MKKDSPASSSKPASDSTENLQGLDELLLANESLIRHGQFYSDIFETVQEILIVLRCSEDGRYYVQKINPAGARILGVDRDEIIEQTLESFFRLKATGDDAFNRMREPQASGVDGMVLSTRGWIPVLASWSLLHEGEEGIKVLSLSDVSELRLAHEEMLRAKEDAQAASRAKSDFLANMSHEIRTPLNAILGITDILLTTPLNEEQKDFVQLFKKSGESLLGLINDILDISKIEARKIEKYDEVFNFREMIAGVQALMQLKAEEKGLKLSFTVDKELSDFHKTDKQKLRQVLFNVVGNAVKFTSQGEVSMRVCLHPDNPRLLHFVVKDTGVGIDAEKQKLLFGHFQQADASITRNFGGSGLGLSISKSFVEMMGGAIGFESLSHVGTVFYFTWPYDPAPAPKEVEKELSEAELMAAIVHPTRLLLVDDNSSNRIIVRTYLKKLPVEVVEAESGQQALDLFNQEGSGFDLILMDIQMPGMDGNEATRKIRGLEQTRGGLFVPIVALTAQAMQEERQVSLEAGCNEHIAKPVSRKNLLSCLVRFTQK